MGKHHMTIRLLGMLTLTGVLGACASAGLGGAVRTDIKKQMDSAHEVITSCFKSALAQDRKLEGTMIIGVKTDPKTGRFQHARVKSSDFRDTQLEQCVIGTVAQLKLDKPTSTSVEADYPITFHSEK